MSQENVETVQRAIAAWNGDDLDAFLAEFDADVEWQPAIEPGLEGRATTYRGHDGARTVWEEDRGEAWERLVIGLTSSATSASRSWRLVTWT